MVSVGTNNGGDVSDPEKEVKLRHPTPEWVTPYVDDDCRLLCTQLTGRCEPLLPGNAESFRDRNLSIEGRLEPGWRHLRDDGRPLGGAVEVPCAGTIVARLDEDGELVVRPEEDSAHREFVTDLSSPLCLAGAIASAE